MIGKYLADSRAAGQYEWLVSHDVLVIVKVTKEFLCVFVNIFWLLQQARAQEIVKDLSQLRMALQVAHVFLFDGMLDGPEVSLQLRVKVFVALHFET